MISSITFRSSKSQTYSIDLPAWTEQLSDFSIKARDICQETIALVESVEKNDKLVNNIPEVCDALSGVLQFVDNAEKYINKLEDVPIAFKNTGGSFLAKQRCTTLLQKAQNSLRESCGVYEVLKTACENAQRSCDAAAAKVNQEVKSANRKNIGARATRGIVTVAGVGAGVGISVVAGVLTLGVGTVVGLASTAALATVGGVGGGVASHYVVASHYSESAGNFRKLSANFSRLSDCALALSGLSSEMTTTLDNIAVNLTRENSKEFVVDLKTNGEQACLRIAVMKSQVREDKTSLESAVALLMREK